MKQEGVDGYATEQVGPGPFSHSPAPAGRGTAGWLAVAELIPMALFSGNKTKTACVAQTSVPYTAYLVNVVLLVLYLFNF